VQNMEDHSALAVAGDILVYVCTAREVRAAAFTVRMCGPLASLGCAAGGGRVLTTHRDVYISFDLRKLLRLHRCPQKSTAIVG